MSVRVVFLVLVATLSLANCAIGPRQSADSPSLGPQSSPIDNFQIVTPDKIYRSGQPDGEGDWEYLQKIGVTTVIKLNQYSANVSEAEELRMAEKHKISVIPLYLQPEDIPHNLNPWVRPDLATLMQAVYGLENLGEGKILVHCSHGKDRTGLVVAIYSLRNKGYCKDIAYKQMQSYGANRFLFGVKAMLYSPNFIERPGCFNTLTSASSL